MTAIRQETADLLDRFHAGDAMSPLQIDRFVIAQNGVTTWGMFRQALREVAARRDVIESHEAAGRWGGRIFWSKLRRRRHAESLRRARIELVHLEGILHRFHAKLVEEVGDLTPETIENLESERFVAMLTRQAQAERIAAHLHVSPGTIAAVRMLGNLDQSDFAEEIGGIEDPVRALGGERC